MSRRHLAFAALLLLTPVVAGCGTGVHAQTNIQGASGNGASVVIGPLSLNGINIVVPPDAKGSGVATDASLMLRVFNGSDNDQLIGVSLPGGLAQSVVTVPRQPTSPGTLPGVLPQAPGTFVPIDLPRASSVSVGQSGFVPDIKIVGLKTTASAFVDVTLQFKNAGNVTVPVLVVPAVGYNSGVPVSR